ncbi:MAG: ABC transporter permease subunit, partial [Candidatus Sumerlaeota bacterium]|nr:ABC transporter permease subunit [Candidatus Sumerlaeota bacterium]
MNDTAASIGPTATGLLLTARAGRLRRLGDAVAHGALFAVTACAALAILLTFAFVIRDAIPFFRVRGFGEFFGSVRWYPLAATPLGLVAALCLSDVLPFAVRQIVKPVIEILAAIPSVAFGFFALVVFAPLLQSHGPAILSWSVWLLGAPVGVVAVAVLSDVATGRLPESLRPKARGAAAILLAALGLAGLALLSRRLGSLRIPSGVNALNASIVLAVMALPTVVSVSEDALSAVGRELREGSYALGATRAETLVRVVIPAAASGISAAVILGVMRAVGETMVVWMASGNAAHVPEPWYNFLASVRTLTA